MANIKDVAKRAEVSAMTVSRVVNGSGYVKENTRKRVLQAMEELNFVPNAVARSLVRQRTHTLALIVPDISNPFFTTVARGCEDIARKHGYQLILCNSDEDVTKEREYIDMIVSLRVEGVLLSPAGDQSLESVQALKRVGTPYVLVDRDVSGVESDLVAGDSIVGATELVNHLVQLGHRRIAIISELTWTSTGRDRYVGYQKALDDAGIALNPEYVKQTSFNLKLGTDVLSELLACEERPTAIFAANNFIAVQVIRELRKHNISVPDDMSVVCFDDVDPNTVADPFLTVAMQPAYEFGSLSTQLLLERINDEAADETDHRKITLKPEIVIRRSAASPGFKR